MDKSSKTQNCSSETTAALQKRLDQRGEVHIPAGTYLLTDTLRVPSDTSIIADPGATFRLADGVGKHVRQFMITNANPGNGNVNISLQGGFWDANNAGNPRGADYDPLAYTGVALNFTNVRGLTLRDFTVHDPESFFVRVGEVSDFHIENIQLSATHIRLNQDGIHVGGFSERGVIRNIRASGKGVPNDDMVALNADDDVERQLNLGMRRGFIRQLLIEDIEAEDAYTFIRLLSVNQPIEDITVRRLRGGCRIHGINMNHWHFPKGVGAIRRIRFEDIDIAKTQYAGWAPAIIQISLHLDDVIFRHVHRPERTLPDAKTLVVDNHQELDMTYNGQTHRVEAATGFVLANEDIDELCMCSCPDPEQTAEKHVKHASQPIN